MKLTFPLVLLCCLQVSAKVYPQETFTLKMDKVGVDRVLTKIQRESSYRFFYNEKNLKDLAPVSISVKQATLAQILDNVLGSSLYYRIVDSNMVVISPREDLSSQHKIQGTVLDEKGTPLPGVTVQIKGTSQGITTGTDGKFSLVIPENAVLTVSFIGYQTQEITPGNQASLIIRLTASSSGLDEVVVVGYGTQKRESITGSIASVKGEQLSVAPVASVANSLAGRLPGLVSLQSSGQPGFDAAKLSIRGFGDALIIVDGVEADFNTLDPNQIASVSILKDGAASIYGSRAGNGVILITTKRGQLGKPVISLNSSYTIQGITMMPKPVSAGQQAELAREEYLQSGKPEANAPYTAEQVQKFYAGTDPQYPNTNWYDELIRDWAPMWQHNIAVRGGSEKIKYYGYFGYENQGTLWKKSGSNYNRYNLMSNVDAKISDNFSLQLDLYSSVGTRKYPPRLASTTATKTAAWEDFWRTSPTYPAALPDPEKNSYADGGGTGGALMTTSMDIAGYAKSVSQDLRGTMALNYQSHAIEGLSAKIFMNYAQNYTTGTVFEKPYKYFTYDYATQTYTQAGSYNARANMTITDTKSRTITGQLSLNYDKTIATDHHLRVLALYEVIDYYNDYLSARRQDFMTDAIDQLYAGSLSGMSNNGSASEMGRASYVGRLNYSYKDKYLLESSLRADASAKFPANERWGYFPSISLGWRLTEENFMKRFGSLDELKLRASYGTSGDDGVGNFQYLTGYQIASSGVTGLSYLFGNNGSVPALLSKGLANPNLTWEKIKIYNAGFEFSLWKGKLYGTGDVFYREETGIPATAITTLPASFGATLPPQNLNSLNNRGFELELGTGGRLGDLVWNVSGNISWSRSKWMHYEEPDYSNDPQQKRINQKSGRWTDEVFGYLTDGLFTSQKQIDDLGFNQDGNTAAPNSSLRPGDLRYKDMVPDSILNWQDQWLIGKGATPHWMFGFNTNFKYKDFDLSALFQGAFGYYKDINVSLGSVYTTVLYDERWTEQNNNPNALVPRLGGRGAGFSDYRYKKAGYLRLKTFSLGYNLPQRWAQAAKLAQARLYVAGTNLVTFDKLKKYGLDPEAPSGMSGSFYYPQQRTISVGANVSF